MMCLSPEILQLRDGAAAERETSLGAWQAQGVYVFGRDRGI